MCACKHIQTNRRNSTWELRFLKSQAWSPFVGIVRYLAKGNQVRTLLCFVEFANDQGFESQTKLQDSTINWKFVPGERTIQNIRDVIPVWEFCHGPSWPRPGKSRLWVDYLVWAKHRMKLQNESEPGLSARLDHRDWRRLGTGLLSIPGHFILG